MKTYHQIWLLCYILYILIIVLLPQALYANSWECISVGMGDTNIHHIWVDDFNPQKLYAASLRAVYATADGGQTWRKIFRTSEEEETITFMLAEPLYTQQVYIGTQYHLFMSLDDGATWQKQYSSSSQEEDMVRTFTINPFNPHELILGTQHGLYQSTDTGSHWRRMYPTIINEPISAVAFHPNINGLLFVMTHRSIYKINLPDEICTKTHIFLSYDDLSDTVGQRNMIHCAPFDDAYITAIHDGTIVESTDRGESWHVVSDRFSLNKKAYSIIPAFSAASLYIATAHDVMRYNYVTRNTHTCTAGLYASRINDLALHEYETVMLFSGTDRGIFATVLTPPTIETAPSPIEIEPHSYEHMYTLFLDEPPILEIQEKAIAYANVSNNKIREWHRNARLRGLLPTFSVDIERSIEDTVDIDRSSTSVDDTYIVGPQETDFTWGCAVEWDLANILWNDDQTTIDYRAKYMIEMREEILHEVTKLYFERRKRQMELHLTPPVDHVEYLNLCLKIDELTAHIDALTGGYLSESLKKRNK